MKLFLNVYAENSKSHTPTGNLQIEQGNMTYRPVKTDGGNRTTYVTNPDGTRSKVKTNKLKRSSAEELKRKKYKYTTDGKKVTKATNGKSATLVSQRGNQGGTLRPANGGTLGVNKALRTNQPLRGRNARKDKATRQGALLKAKALLRNPRA